MVSDKRVYRDRALIARANGGMRQRPLALADGLRARLVAFPNSAVTKRKLRHTGRRVALPDRRVQMSGYGVNQD
jgi:hypothetical protein